MINRQTIGKDDRNAGIVVGEGQRQYLCIGSGGDVHLACGMHHLAFLLPVHCAHEVVVACVLGLELVLPLLFEVERIDEEELCG